MHSRSLVTLGGLILVLACGRALGAADPPPRKPLGAAERKELLTLVKAVDLAQQTDVTSEVAFLWDSHVLKGANEISYVPFVLGLNGLPENFKSAAMYVRAVSRRDGVRGTGERSAIVDWLVRGSSLPARTPETVVVGPGEIPVGGPAMRSTNPSLQAAAGSSALLALQERAREKQLAEDEAAKRKSEDKRPDPFLFPYEEYYFLDLNASRTLDAPIVERALALPPGEFDVYIGLLDRARAKTSGPVVVKHTVTVPDFWNDRLGLSSLILVDDVRVLRAPLKGDQQSAHPYTLGLSELIPKRTRSFGPQDPLSVVFQVCNYGAPDSDLAVEYNFYRFVNGARVLFNRTDPQRFGDTDLPPAGAWESQTFVTQSVSLQTFSPGPYELEVTVKDRLTRGMTTASVAFTVAPGVK